MTSKTFTLLLSCLVTLLVFNMNSSLYLSLLSEMAEPAMI